jgi:D-serine deaminase-like pyridoxal phosphate-dependent protein
VGESQADLSAERGLAQVTQDLLTLPTPALVLDIDKMDRNVARLAAIMARHQVILRPHLKTAKSVDVARRLHPDGPGPITVSTLAEGGYKDITYAVGLDPSKASRALALSSSGVDLKLTLDSVEQAEALAKAASGAADRPSVMIEIDCDGHRGGLAPDHADLVGVANAVTSAGLALAGVLTHAGASYDLHDPEALANAAENEGAAAVYAAERLRASGHDCPVVSVGSTPTSHFARDLAGVTEVRAGVFMFFDLVMHGIGVCDVDDIALSVLATVIGTKPEKGWILIDAGWMALSRDRGTSKQAVDQGYGLVCDADGNAFGDLIVEQANQEHGIIALRSGSGAALPLLPVGTRLRILPNHACATGAQHDAFNVVRSGGKDVVGVWPRMRGW